MYSLTITCLSFLFKVQHADYTYKINLCGSVSGGVSGCETAMVCRTGNTGSKAVSFGEPKNYQFNKESNFLSLTYDSGGECSM